MALGEKVGALYSADDSLRHGIEAAARRTDEGIQIVEFMWFIALCMKPY